MSSHACFWLLVALAWLGTGTVAAAEGPGLGTPVDADTLEALDLTVLPDGRGLPEGSGNAARGAEVYRLHCRACHGPQGRGGPNDPLAGGVDSLGGDEPLKTVGSYWPYATTVFDYIRRAMPYQAPGSLSADDVYAVTAFLLRENGIVGDDTVLDAATLPRVVMPNRSGFHDPYATREGATP